MWANGRTYPGIVGIQYQLQALADELKTEKRSNHAPGSLESMVENLVKNWEVEASHKLDAREWRTVDPDTYKFSCNGGVRQDASHMLKV